MSRARSRALLAAPAPLLAALAVLAAPALAGADGLSLTLEPAYRASERETRAADGSETVTSDVAFDQRYRLTLGKTLWPYLTVSGAGLYQLTRGFTETDGVDGRTLNEAWTGNLGLTFGPPVLGGQAAYDRREVWSSQKLSGQARTTVPERVTETWSGGLGWRPLGLPTLDLVLSRREQYDAARALDDLVSSQAALTVGYRELRDLDLRASARYSTNEDRRANTRTEELTESAAAVWSTRFLEGRGTGAVSYTLARRDGWTEAPAGATLVTQQLAAEGLTFLQDAADLSTEATARLVTNTRVVDGDVGQPAGLDLGTAIPPAEHGLRREAGVRFVDAQTPVNRLYVYVDRALPLEVWQRFTWGVWRSDDNVTWTPVDELDPLLDPGKVGFGAFENRFELEIPRTTARYLKVVTRPLPDGVTDDPAFAQLQVTEVQALIARAAEEVRGHDSDTGGTFNATARVRLDPRWNLAYDGSVFLVHGERVAWSLANGVGAGRRLGEHAGWTARLGRTDSGDSTGHTGQTQLSATLTAEPLPTLAGSLTASGQVSERPEGIGWAATTSALARAELYEGLSLSANGAATTARGETGLTSRSMMVGVSTEVTPHRVFTVAGAYSLNRSFDDNRGWQDRSRAEASASFTPFPALGASGSISRSWELGKGSTVASFSAAATPLRGGALTLGFSYTEGLTGSTEERQRSFGPTARLTLRPGVYVDGSYSVSQTRAPAVDQDAHSLLVNLFVALR